MANANSSSSPSDYSAVPDWQQCNVMSSKNSFPVTYFYVVTLSKEKLVWHDSTDLTDTAAGLLGMQLFCNLTLSRPE